MRLAHFGTFDVENFGDLLFPLLLENKLATVVDEFIHVAPAGGGPVWADCVESQSVAQVLNGSTRVDAVVIGGGQIICGLPTRIAHYQSDDSLPWTAYPSCWFGAFELARKCNVPLLWNAPGVPTVLDPKTASLLGDVTAGSQYVTVRDETSRLYLLGAGVTQPIQCVPDTAFDVPDLWTLEELDEAVTRVFQRQNRPPPSRTVAIHLNRRFAGEDTRSVARHVDQLANRWNAVPLVVALGPCHGDSAWQLEVTRWMQSNPVVVDRPESLRELVACVARSVAYVGCSMHGLITAIAFEKPVIAVSSAVTDRRIEDLLASLHLTDCRSDSWEDAVSRSERLLRRSRDSWSEPIQTVRPLLCEHWLRVGEIVQSCQSGTSASDDHPRSASCRTEDVPSGKVQAGQTAGAVTETDWEQTIMDRMRSEQARWVMQQWDLAERERTRLESKVFDAAAELRHASKQCRDLKETNAAQRRELSELRTKLRKSDTECSRLESHQQLLAAWLGNVEFLIHELLMSKRWRVGNLVGDLWRRMFFRPAVPLATESMRSVFERFHRWKDAKLDANEKTATTGMCSVGPAPLPVADIIICIHNSLDCVTECLESVSRSTDSRHRLLLIDDGSQEPTRQFLQKFLRERLSAAQPRSMMIRNEEARGYTKSANQGMRICDSDYAVLLNSDTLVSPGWLDRLLECGQSHPSIGIVGPLSNAATWQSVPVRFHNEDWATNPLPPGWSVADVAECVSMESARVFPRVPIVNGFCMAVKRDVLRTVGLFDEQRFSPGYGEENDYCLRALDAGFQCAIADHAYVFHKKSQSFTNEQRRKLSRKAHRRLEQKHGRQRVKAAIEELRNHAVLSDLRTRYLWQFSQPNKSRSRTAEAHVSPLFILPVPGGGGGAHCIVQEALAMRRCDSDARVAVPVRFQALYQAAYPEAESAGLFSFYSDDQSLVDFAKDYSVAVATIYHSMRLVRDIVAAHPHVYPAYYIQDYEPYFFSEHSSKWRQARASYTLLPHTLRFAKTDWICRTVAEQHRVNTVRPAVRSVDHSLFYPDLSHLGGPPDSGKPVRIMAMIRPSTPRRGAERTMRVLGQLQQGFGELGEQVATEIHSFGCSDQDILNHQLPSKFPFINHGVLNRIEVAEQLRAADIFVDLSTYQAFGQTAVEAMASGCAVVVPLNGGAVEYAEHEINSLVVDTRNEEDCLMAIRRLVEDARLRQRLATAAIGTTAHYSNHTAAMAQLRIFAAALKRHQMESSAVESNDSGSSPAAPEAQPLRRPPRDMSPGIFQQNEEDNPLAVLICGHARSGTTALSALIRQHPAIDGRFECGFLLANDPAGFLECDPFPDLLKRGWNITHDDVRFICRAASWSEAYCRLRERSELPDKSVRLYDKTPRYMVDLPNVLRKVDVPCITIVKDPREVYWANLKRNEARATSIERFCNYYLEYAHQWEAAQHVYGNRMLLVQYERLCDDPLAEGKRIFDFLQLEFNSEFVLLPNPLDSPIYGHGGISDQFVGSYRDNITADDEREILARTKYFACWHMELAELRD